MYDSLLRTGAAISEQDALGESGVGFSENGQSAKNAQQRVQQQFETGVDAVLNGTYASRNDLLMGGTPTIYKEIGMTDLPFVISPSHVYSIAKSVGEAKRDGRFREYINYHGMGAEAVKEMYERISNPIMVIAAQDNQRAKMPIRGRDSVHKVIAIVVLSKNGKEVIAPIAIEDEANINPDRIDANRVLTYYEKKKMDELIREAVAKENIGEVGVYYADKTKSQALVKQAGIQFSGRFKNYLASDSIIHHLGENASISIGSVENSLQFKRWFGKSKAVKKDGSPRLLYHYTDAEFDSFDVGRSESNQGDRLGDGIYLSSSPTSFASYGKNRLEMYASIQNSFEMQLSEDQANLVLDRYASAKHDLDSFDGLYREHALSKLTNPIRVMDYLKEYAKDNGIKVSDILKDLGYDGVHDGIEWVAFDPTQVKSATGNIGTFDGSNQKFNFSENAPTKRQSSLNEAWELFDNNSTPAAYYESNPRGFDLQTSNLLRGLMLRNGENVGGTLSDARMERIAEIFAGANRRNALSLSLSSPVRVFEDVRGWGGRTAEERAKNVRNGNLLKNTYYEYGNLQAANRETWIAENMRPVIEATTKQNPVNSCPDGRGAAGAARRIRLRRKGLFRLLCRRCRYAPCPPDMEEYEVPAGPGRCLNVRGPYRKPCRTCSAAP